MDFDLDEVERGLRDTARACLAARPDGDGVRGGGVSPDLPAWSRLVGLGWFDPDMPAVSRTVLAEECGYALARAPWWPRLAMDLDRTARTGLAWSAGEPAPPVTARPAGSDPAVLDGTFPAVPGLPSLDEVVVPVRDPTGLHLLVVSGHDRGMQVGTRLGLDSRRPTGELICRGVRAETLDVRDPAAWLREVHHRGLVLLAAEALGVARRAFEMAAAHARDRSQFGRAIGRFQGVAFPVADAYLELEVAWSLTYRAAWVMEQADPGPETVSEAVAVALAAARRAAVCNCERAVQIFGAAAMTWEHPIHPYYRRALWIQAFGPPTARLHAETATALMRRTGAG